jgi:hypothetical protein
MRMYDSLKRTHCILSLSMISFTHITYSVWVPNDGFPSFDDRLSVFDLYPLCCELTLTSSLSSFSFFFRIGVQALNGNGYLSTVGPFPSICNRIW